MNDEQRRQIQELNERHFTEFGKTLDGKLLFQWMRTDEMPIEMKRDLGFKVDKKSGLTIASRQFKRMTFADLYGGGACWTIAAFEHGMSREMWLAKFGDSLPWHAAGLYRPVDCITLALQNPPDEEISMRAAYNIRRTLEITSKGVESAYKHFLEETQADTAAAQADHQRQVDDMVDDAAPAFNNNPGGKGSTSFPSHSQLPN